MFLFAASLQRWSLIHPTEGGWIGWGNYATLATDLRFRSALWRTAQFTAVGVAVQVLLGMAVALILAGRFPGAWLARGLFLLPMIMTPIVVGLTWRMLYDPIFGQINWLLGLAGLPQPSWLSDAALVMPALIIVDVWQWTPFLALIFVAGLQSVPPSQYEAAALDGAGPVARFVFITLPALRPLILIAVLFRTMDSLRWFDTIFVMTNGGPGTASETANLYAYITSFNNANLGYGAAQAVVILVLVIAVSLVLVRLSGIERDP